MTTPTRNADREATAAILRLVVTVELTPWRESTPPGMLLRDWAPTTGGLPTPECCGEPGLRGAAACVRDEGPVAVGERDQRWSWRIWTPIGTVWPYRSGRARSAEDAQTAADEALKKLAEDLVRAA